MATIAILSDDGFLDGLEEKDEPESSDIVVDPGIDLPLDGTYKWDGKSKSFIPRGHGFERPDSSPVPSQLIMYQLIKRDDSALSREMRMWKNWYEENLLQRHMESVHRSKKVKTTYGNLTSI